MRASAIGRVELLDVIGGGAWHDIGRLKPTTIKIGRKKYGKDVKFCSCMYQLIGQLDIYTISQGNTSPGFGMRN